MTISGRNPSILTQFSAISGLSLASVRILVGWLLLIFSYGAPSAAPACEFQGVAVFDDFSGAAFESCEFDTDGRLTLIIAPEDETINPSPWFAFRLSSESAKEQQLVLQYVNAKHRYVPDFAASDGVWRVLAQEQVVVEEEGRRAQFTLGLEAGNPVTVAAQPLLVAADYQQWMRGLSKLDGSIAVKEVGRSPGGRALWRMTTPSRQQTLLILGRQHPPETTGAQAMMVFLERLLTEDSLARAFRDDVGLLVYPLMNPDGVDAGHWRHNTGSTDLNRDWGPFTQLETRTVAADIHTFLKENDSQLIKAIDFHSTWYEVFYTQDDNTAAVMPGLLGAWLEVFDETMRSRDPDFALNRKAGHNADRPTSKAYFFEQYGVAATTLEIGDGAGIDYIREYAIVAAESFMQAWLRQKEGAF